MTLDDIREWAEAKRGRKSEIAAELGITPDMVSKALRPNPIRKFTYDEMARLRALVVVADEPIAGSPIRRGIPIIGRISASHWREAVQSPIGVMPAFADSIPSNAFALEVDGDSMDLHVPDGGHVVIDPDDKALFPDRFYAVENAEGEATFKQFKSEPARFAPCSTNPVHQDIIIGATPFEVIGRVIWRAARM